VLLSNGQSVSLAPQALGETTSLTTAGYFYSSQGLQLEQQFATYSALYRAQPWVAIVVDKVANSLARLGVQVWDQADPNGNVIDSTGPLARLLARPNSEMSPYSFWRWIQSTYEIYGETFAVKGRNEAGQIIELVPMHPSRTTVERDKDGTVHYIFTSGTNGSQGYFQATSDDVIPFLRFNPENLMRGWSRLESLRSTLMSEDSARRATAAWWRNMGRPSMVLSTGEKKLSADGQARLKESFDSVHAGSGNAGGTVVLQDGLTAAPMQLSAEEMQYIQSRMLNREEVCAGYDIPPPVVHILDHATYSNITEQMRSMYRDTMAPRIQEVESTLDTHLGSEFNGAKYARFSVADILRGDIDARATTATKLVERGIAKPSEMRPWFDLNDAGPVADELYANSTMQRLGRPAERITITEAAAASPEASDDANNAISAANQAMVQDHATAGNAAPSVPAPAVPLPKKHLHTFLRQLGRGKSLTDITNALLDAHPADRADILATAELAAEKETA